MTFSVHPLKEEENLFEKRALKFAFISLYQNEPLSISIGITTLRRGAIAMTVLHGATDFLKNKKNNKNLCSDLLLFVVFQEIGLFRVFFFVALCLMAVFQY